MVIRYGHLLWHHWPQHKKIHTFSVCCYCVSTFFICSTSVSSLLWYCYSITFFSYAFCLLCFGVYYCGGINITVAEIVVIVIVIFSISQWRAGIFKYLFMWYFFRLFFFFRYQKIFIHSNIHSSRISENTQLCTSLDIKFSFFIYRSVT